MLAGSQFRLRQGFRPRRKHLYGAPAPPRLAGPHGMEMYLFGYISIFSYPENGPALLRRAFSIPIRAATRHTTILHYSFFIIHF